MKKILLFIALSSLVFGATPNLEFLKKQENSLAKDYYIHRLFEENKINKQEAKTLRSHIFRYAGKLRKEFEKYIPYKAYVDPKYAKCFNYSASSILDANATCQAYRLNSLAFVKSLSPDTRGKLANKFSQSNANLSTLLLAFNQNDPLAYIIAKNNTTHFFKVYNYLKSPDLSLPKSYLDQLATQKEFKKLAQTTIIQKTHPKLRASFLQISPINASDDVAFYLGLNALLFDKEKEALLFFNSAYNTFQSPALRDNALFWIWQISKAKADLNTLAQSKNVNIYSLYAKELTNSPKPEVVVLEAHKKAHSNFNMQDPFAWQKLNKRILKANEHELGALAKEFNSKETLPIYAYVMERKDKFKKEYFIMPYYEYIKDYDTKRRAMILAIARQESRFIPTAISTSYALGIMQFMPFLANHIAHKELKIPNFDQDDMFKPQTAYFFANHHLNYLQKELDNIVFISYAYNGGIGFTKRMLARNDMFKNGKFEPFLSMEFVPYQESRNYAKKVLANYIVYLHLLNDNTTISSIFQSLVSRNAH